MEAIDKQGFQNRYMKTRRRRTSIVLKKYENSQQRKFAETKPKRKLAAALRYSLIQK